MKKITAKNIHPTTSSIMKPKRKCPQALTQPLVASSTSKFTLSTMAAESWAREQQELQRLLDTARNDINKMVGFERDGMRQQMMKCKKDARNKLKRVATGIPKLESSLQEQRNITDSELRYRASELKKLKKGYTECRNIIENKNNSRSNLNIGKQRDMASMESYGTMEMSNQQLRQQQFDKRDEMDQDLDDVLKGVKRINNITYDINAELERQDVIIDEIGDKMDTANQKVGTNVARVEFLNRKAKKDRGCCCLMCVLLLAIIAMLIWNVV